MSYHNTAAVSRLLQVMGTAPESAVGEYFTSNWVNHDPTLPPLRGLEGAAGLLRIWQSAFSNLRAEVEDSVEAGDKVACRFRMTGTHTGPLMGIAASGKSVSILATGIFRVVDGKLAENWVNLDSLGLLQQIGAVPEMGKQPA
jgi:predicted ester cyclase